MAKPKEHSEAQKNILISEYQNKVFKNENPLPSIYKEIVLVKGLTRDKSTYDIVYNFDKLKHYQHNAAMAAFRQIDTLEKNNTPSFAEQARVIVNDIRDLAFAYMLSEKHKNGDSYTYIPCLKKNTTETHLLDEFDTEQTMLLLHEVQPDFFYKHGISRNNAVELVKELMSSTDGIDTEALSKLITVANQSTLTDAK